MRALLLIRHSLPEVRQDIPASSWQLSAAGMRRARLLASKIAGYGLQRLYSSQELKAVQTAEILASALKLPHQPVPDLHEHLRSADPNFNLKSFEASVGGLFAHPAELVFGSETADQAHERFRSAVDSLLKANPGQNIAIVAHGTVISLFVSRACGIEPFPLWKSLGLPSCLVLNQSPNNDFALVKTIQSPRKSFRQDLHRSKLI